MFAFAETRLDIPSNAIRLVSNTQETCAGHTFMSWSKPRLLCTVVTWQYFLHVPLIVQVQEVNWYVDEPNTNMILLPLPHLRKRRTARVASTARPCLHVKDARQCLLTSAIPWCCMLCFFEFSLEQLEVGVAAAPHRVVTVLAFCPNCPCLLHSDSFPCPSPGVNGWVV